MWVTHSYLGTTLRGFRCLFFLLFEDYIEAQSGFSKDVSSEIERFARNMGNFGAVVVPFTGDVPETRKNILDKNWTAEERELIVQTPAMLMIDRDFDEFDPRRHPWVLFHFGRSGNQDAAQLRSLLGKMTDAVAAQGADPFVLVRSAIRNAGITEGFKSVELKPGIFGLSVDVRAAWGALKEYLRSQKSQS